MPFSPKSLEEKPYNVCVTCDRLGVHCDGPNFFAMEIQRLSEWSRLRKDHLHKLDPKWTNAFIAEQAEVSKVSVDRFLAGTIDDIKMSTIARILRVLVNGTWGKYPCAMSDTEKEVVFTENPALVERAEKTEQECERLRTTLDKLISDHQNDVAAAHSEDRAKIDYLLKQIEFKEEQMKVKDQQLQERYDFLKRKDRVIRILSVLLAIALLLIFAALVVDRLNSDMGFFWIDRMSAVLHGELGTADQISRFIPL